MCNALILKGLVFVIVVRRCTNENRNLDGVGSHYYLGVSIPQNRNKSRKILGLRMFLAWLELGLSGYGWLAEAGGGRLCWDGG